MDRSCRPKHIGVVSVVQIISCIPAVPTRSTYRSVRCVKDRAELGGGVEKRALFEGLLCTLAACGAERQASRKAAHSADAQPPLRTRERQVSGSGVSETWSGTAEQ